MCPKSLPLREKCTGVACRVHDVGHIVDDVGVAVLVDDAGPAALAGRGTQLLPDQQPPGEFEHAEHEGGQEGEKEGQRAATWRDDDGKNESEWR